MHHMIPLISLYWSLPPLTHQPGNWLRCASHIHLHTGQVKAFVVLCMAISWWYPRHHTSASPTQMKPSSPAHAPACNPDASPRPPSTGSPSSPSTSPSPTPSYFQNLADQHTGTAPWRRRWTGARARSSTPTPSTISTPPRTTSSRNRSARLPTQWAYMHHRRRAGEAANRPLAIGAWRTSVTVDLTSDICSVRKPIKTVEEDSMILC